MNKLFKSLLFIVIGAALVSCSLPIIPNPSTPSSDISVTSISLNKHVINMQVGEKEQLIATINPSDATDQIYSWSISNFSIANVDNGLVTALKVGQATITVTTHDGNYQDSCVINVLDAKIDGQERLAINEYGDYVEYVSSATGILKDDYTALTKSEVYYENGIFKAEYQVGLYEFFNIENKVEIIINIAQEELNKLEEDYQKNNRESYRICSLDITYLNLHFHYEEVGIRQKGNTSRGNILNGDNINLRHYKLSFEETFDDEYTSTPKQWDDLDAKEVREDRKFFGIDKIDIRWNRNEDHTYLKEYYAYEMHRNSGGLAPSSNVFNLKLNINGVLKNAGLYLAVENINKGFIKRNFVKSARNGDLYKIGWNNSGSCGSFSSTDNSLFGVETLIKNGDSFYQQVYVYDLKTNKSSSSHQAIKNFINIISDSSFHGGDSYEFMNNYAVYDAFIAFASSLFLAGDPDDLRANGNNTYVYFAPDGENTKAIFIPTDHDRAFASCGGGGNPTNSFTINESPFSNHLGYGPSNLSTLFNKTIVSSNSVDIRNDYLKKINEIINNSWLDINKFTNYFNILKAHYFSSLELGSGINYHDIPFSLEEGTNISANENLSIEVYFSKKVESINKFFKNNNISF